MASSTGITKAAPSKLPDHSAAAPTEDASGLAASMLPGSEVLPAPVEESKEPLHVVTADVADGALQPAAPSAVETFVMSIRDSLNDLVRQGASRLSRPSPVAGHDVSGEIRI